MKQLEFEAQNQEFWRELDDLLKSPADAGDDQLRRFPQDYRRLCQNLALAKSRQYSMNLIGYLNDLVQAGYQNLYSSQLSKGKSLLDFFAYGFPSVLRNNGPTLWLAAAVFVLPYLALMIGCWLNDELIYSLMDPFQVRMMESMYEPSLQRFGRERQSDSDVLMFGYYIYNNIGIAFRCFATGIFAGVGSLFTLAFNGLVIGGVSGHLSNLGYGITFYPFVIGHGSFELTAIVFSGAAGLKLGYALIAPGQLSRKQALVRAASDAIKIMYGVFVMLMIAAFIEAFWSSSSTIPDSIKYIVGAALWLFVFYYCFFFARTRVAAYNSLYAAR